MRSRAAALMNTRVKLGDACFAQVVIWQLPASVPASAHGYKYRMALVDAQVCVLRYDNEAGKGDHKHIEGRQVDYTFTTLDQLVDDFWADVARYLKGKPDDNPND